MKPVQYDVEMVELNAMATANTEAHTEVAPLMPQSQGVSVVDLLEATFIPRGKAMPMNSPMGKSMPKAKKMRMYVFNPWNLLMRPGVSHPSKTRIIRRADNSSNGEPEESGLPILCVR